jgi:phytoene synthase
LHARAHDLHDDPVPDLAALEDYADASSGELSRLALELLGVDADAAHRAARRIGIAWALTGLVRATPFLARRRRLMLPSDLLAAHDVSAEALFAGRPGPGLRTVLEALAARARELVREARIDSADMPQAALPALLPAGLAERHLAALQAAGFDVFADVPAPNPALTSARLWWTHARRRY